MAGSSGGWSDGLATQLAAYVEASAHARASGPLSVTEIQLLVDKLRVSKYIDIFIYIYTCIYKYGLIFDLYI